MEGWVSFHRKIEEWEWYDDANTFRLFFHLVLKANHKDNKWRGIDIKRGEIVTSNEQLAKQLKLTISKIRTSLEKLKSTGEITIKTTNKNTVVTIANYDLYQSVDGRIANKTTDKSQSNRNQIATNNNDNNENNEKKEDISSDIEEIRSNYKGTKTKADAYKKLPKLIKLYSKEKLIESIKNYNSHVAKERSNGFKDLKYMNESTFWNGRYMDYLDENFEKVKEKTNEKTVDGIKYIGGLRVYE